MWDHASTRRRSTLHAAAHAALLNVRAVRHVDAGKPSDNERRIMGAIGTHKRQMRPQGKQRMAVMIPHTPYFLEKSWLPAAHMPMTTKHPGE